MYRDRDAELRRLQEQLLEDEEPETDAELLDEETLDELLSDSQKSGDSKVYQNFSNGYGKRLRNYASGYKAYNSDTTDTDLERYSEEVREPKHSGCLLWLGALLAVAAAVVLWLYLRLGGYI